MEKIVSIRNQLVQDARLLRDRRRERARYGLAILEGIKTAREALAAAVSISHYFYTEDLATRPGGEALLSALQRADLPGHVVAAQVLAALADTENPQGIVVVFHTPRLAAADLCLPRANGRHGPMVLADGVQDPGNLGTLIRTAAALGSGGVIAGSGTADPYGPKVVRAAAGGLFRLPVAVADTAEALDELHGRGVRVWVADAASGQAPWEVNWAAGAALIVIGNEGAGPSAAARRAAHGVVRIPMPGPSESLNAGVAGALCLYEAMRQREHAIDYR